MPPRKKNVPKKQKAAKNLKKRDESTTFSKKSSSVSQITTMKKNEKISVHVTKSAAGRWKVIRPDVVNHIHEIVNATVIEVVSKLPKRKRVRIAEIVREFSEDYTNNLKKQKVPLRRAEPYSQLRKNIHRLEELLVSSDNRIDKLETEISSIEKQIEQMETFIATEEEEKDLPQLFADMAENMLELPPYQ